MTGEIEQHGGPLPPAWRQSAHGIEPVPGRCPGPGDRTVIRPDFVLAGCRLPDGQYQVIASRDVSGSGLSADYGYAEARLPGWDPPVLTSRKITLSAALGHFLVVEAADYSACMAAVSRRWREQG